MLQNIRNHALMIPTISMKIGMAATFLLIPFWLRFQNTKAHGMGDFAVFYSAGFIIFWPIVWTLVWWGISGFAGLRTAWANRTQRAWLITLITFAGLILLSWVWSYKRESYPSVALSAALPFIMVLLFSMCLSASNINLRTILLVLMIGLSWNSVLASLQVATQGSLGLRFLGEFQVNPARSGTVIVQVGDIRWLRPYGLLPHPNMLAGFFLIGLLVTVGFALSVQSKRWIIVVGIFTFGLWSLYLSFSRSAWLGFALGLMIIAYLTIPAWRRSQNRLMRVLIICGTVLITAGLFVILYHPFLAARTGVTDEALERRSSSDRVIYNQIALDAINQSPILGVGIGNYPWYASDFLAKTAFDLKGQPVHNIFLSAWAELGVIGLGLFIAAITFALISGLKNLRKLAPTSNEYSLYAAALATVGALLVIGLFDHYPWTLIQFQVPFWGLMAVITRPPSAVQELA